MITSLYSVVPVFLVHVPNKGDQKRDFGRSVGLMKKAFGMDNACYETGINISKKTNMHAVYSYASPDALDFEA